MRDNQPPFNGPDDDRFAAEDLRRQFQERDAAAPNAALPRRARPISNRDSMQRLNQITTSLGLTRQAAKGLIDQYNALLTNQQLRTKYDDPAWDAVLRTLQTKIENACAVLRIPLKSGVVTGVDPIGSTHARQYRVPLTNASIVSVGAHLFFFCSVISKAMARSLIYTSSNEGHTICYDPIKVISRIKSDQALTRYWVSILVSFALVDGPHLVPFELHEPHIAATRLQLLEAMELFVLAHELGHHVSAVVPFGNLPISLGDNESHNEEIRADIFASTVLNYLGGEPHEINLYAGSGAAAVLLLSIFEMIAKAKTLLTRNNSIASASSTHPENADRFSAIAATVDCMSHGDDRVILSDVRNSFAAIAEGLWTHLHDQLLLAVADASRTRK